MEEEKQVQVNRHTGGLETLIFINLNNGMVNRHTGGLENVAGVDSDTEVVNRHTGGLKNTNIGIIAL